MNPGDELIQPVAIPGQKALDGQGFPLVLRCASSAANLSALASWCRANRRDLEARAATHGTILFRGFPLRTAEDFDGLVVGLGFPNFPYRESLSNAVRINRTERVFTANEAPPDVPIFLHHEMAQTPIYPSKLFFFCEQSAAQGGATPICRSDVLYERLMKVRPGFLRRCETKGLRYTTVMPPIDDPDSGMGRSWQGTLRAQDRGEAENRLRQLGYTWEWTDSGCLRATTPVLPAVRQLANGRHAFFNQLIAAFQGWKDRRNDPAKAIRFGDGQPLDPAAVLHAVALANEITFDIPWETGDVAWVDNFMTMHGRRPFKGTRRVLASLAVDP